MAWLTLKLGCICGARTRSRVRYRIEGRGSATTFVPKISVTEMKAKGLEGGAEALLTKPIDFVNAP